MTILDLLAEPHRAAYKRAAAEVLFPLGYGTPVARVTVNRIEADGSFGRAHPQARLRNLCEWIWCHHVKGQTYGHGQMDRSYERALANWQNNPRQFSHPNRSWHVRKLTPPLSAVACDVVGTGHGGSPPDGFAAIRANVGPFLLRTVTGSTERHHTQFADLPGTGDQWSGQPIKRLTAPPRLPDRFYDGAAPVPPPITSDVAWDPEHHNYWWFPMDPAKPTRKQGDADTGAIGHVRYLQHAVRVAAYLQVKSGLPMYADVASAVGNPDGKFGPRTHLAVVRFQNFRGLDADPDGVVGPQTWADLDAHIRLAQAGA